MVKTLTLYFFRWVSKRVSGECTSEDELISTAEEVTKKLAGAGG